MSTKAKYWTAGILLTATALYVFAPPLVDFSGKGSRFNQWLHKNDVPKTPKK